MTGTLFVVGGIPIAILLAIVVGRLSARVFFDASRSETGAVVRPLRYLDLGSRIRRKRKLR